MQRVRDGELQTLQEEEEEELQRKQWRMELGQGDLALEKHWNRQPREVVECPPLPGGVQGMTGRGIQCCALVGRAVFGQRVDLDRGGPFSTQLKGFCNFMRLLQPKCITEFCKHLPTCKDKEQNVLALIRLMIGNVMVVVLVLPSGEPPVLLAEAPPALSRAHTATPDWSSHMANMKTSYF